MSNADLIGREFKVSAFDGYAKYRVASDNGDGTVNIENVPQIHEQYGDVGYRAPLLDEWCRIGAENIRALLARNTH